ncbi:hypothetical protein [Sphaerisporangium fuscum]|uniref:hypothetical protein n=1 Tax=Sphaerisporangium fuscum TaxID=2835868 RepID=UPI001BDD362A|nr:hypothetical protein [Sphaerisporangium fuscum]
MAAGGLGVTAPAGHDQLGSQQPAPGRIGVSSPDVLFQKRPEFTSAARFTPPAETTGDSNRKDADAGQDADHWAQESPRFRTS